MKHICLYDISQVFPNLHHKNLASLTTQQYKYISLIHESCKLATIPQLWLTSDSTDKTKRMHSIMNHDHHN